jgi:hypothetical protein
MNAGPLAPGDLSGPTLPSETLMAPMNETETYGGARDNLSGSGGLVRGE